MKNFSVKVNNKEYWVSRSVAVITFIFKEKNGTLYSLIEKEEKVQPITKVNGVYPEDMSISMKHSKKRVLVRSSKSAVLLLILIN